MDWIGMALTVPLDSFQPAAVCQCYDD